VRLHRAVVGDRRHRGNQRALRLQVARRLLDRGRRFLKVRQDVGRNHRVEQAEIPGERFSARHDETDRRAGEPFACVADQPFVGIEPDHRGRAGFGQARRAVPRAAAEVEHAPAHRIACGEEVERQVRLKQIVRNFGRDDAARGKARGEAGKGVEAAAERRGGHRPRVSISHLRLKRSGAAC
jgi:hypothetical protein